MSSLNIITIETTAIDRFKKTWPCHGIDEAVEAIVFAEDCDGNLVDISYIGTHPVSGQEIELDSDFVCGRNYDHGAIPALLEDAVNHCKKETVATSAVHGTATHFVYR